MELFSIRIQRTFQLVSTGNTYTVCLCLKQGEWDTVHGGALRVTIDCGEQGNDVV